MIAFAGSVVDHDGLRLNLASWCRPSEGGPCFPTTQACRNKAAGLRVRVEEFEAMGAGWTPGG